MNTFFKEILLRWNSIRHFAVILPTTKLKIKKTKIKMANKLHEILAVEQDRKNRANIVIGETKKRFTKHTTDFEGLVKSTSQRKKTPRKFRMKPRKFR